MNTFVDSFFRTKGRLNRKGYMLRLVILLVLIFFCQIVMSQLANAQGNLRYAVFFFLIAQFILVIGNLFIAAMTEVLGDVERALTESSKVLAVKGRVL